MASIQEVCRSITSSQVGANTKQVRVHHDSSRGPDIQHVFPHGIDRTVSDTFEHTTWGFESIPSSPLQFGVAFCAGRATDSLQFLARAPPYALVDFVPDGAPSDSDGEESSS